MPYLRDYWYEMKFSDLFKLINPDGRYQCPRYNCGKSYKDASSLQRHIRCIFFFHIRMCAWCERLLILCLFTFIIGMSVGAKRSFGVLCVVKRFHKVRIWNDTWSQVFVSNIIYKTYTLRVCSFKGWFSKILQF